MHKPLNWVVDGVDDDGRAVARLEGSITERTDFAELLAKLAGAKAVVLDLHGVESINSVGVRQWLTFVRALGGATADLAIQRCAVPMVAQMNMVAGFAGDARVKSILIPLLCETRGREGTSEVETTSGTIPELQTPPCENCGAQMEFDDLIDSYFGFLVR